MNDNAYRYVRRGSLIVGIILIIVVVVFTIVDYRSVRRAPTDFLSCVTAGYPVQESFPRRCAVTGGQTFVEDIGTTLEKDNLIRVASPRPNAVVTAPLEVLGSARGTWFFEASFPIVVENADGGVIGQGIATALGEWMTEEFVPFSAKISYTLATTQQAVLVLKKDNPSGLPEHDDELRIPVMLTKSDAVSQVPPQTPPVSVSVCRPSGCSGQICSDEDIASNCEFRPEYACYKEATCERQVGGECGWTQTATLSACLANPPAVQ